MAIGSRYTFGNLAAQVSGNERVTFIIRSSAVDGASYRSREYTTGSERPVLEVT